jgi:glycosyltransferase involved in cell wall biosynthesis
MADKAMNPIVSAVKKLIRPLIPDRVMARVRLRQQSRHYRSNVLIIVSNRREARRWLAVTPDTYQVTMASPGFPDRPYLIADNPQDPEPAVAEIVVAGSPPMVESFGDQAAAALTTFGLDAVVVARTSPPSLWKKIRAEPRTEPTLLATWGVVWREAGGWTEQQPLVPMLADRIGAAGRRVGLVPYVDEQRPRGRTDPIMDPLVVVLAAVPLHDVGGGSRGAQMAFELLRRGYHVVYVNVFESTESVDLGLRFLHPGLEQVSLAHFDAGTLAARVLSDVKLAIIELPYGELIPHLAGLASSGFHVIYELIDDWSARSLGGEWFRPADEAALVALAKTHVATAPDLVERLEGLAGSSVALVPNAVNETNFGGEPGPVPADFPAGEGPVIGYHGSLYGDWFDWSSVARVAAAFPHGRVLVIGDDRGHPSLPDNVHFLGLKAQSDLLAYVARFDVGLVPFITSEVTHAVSPLKVYEYLAAGVPVAAPPLRALANLEGVVTDPDLVAAVRTALETPRPERRHVLIEHSWAQRLEAILQLVGLKLAPVTAPGPVVKRRPAIHHPQPRRIL